MFNTGGIFKKFNIFRSASNPVLQFSNQLKCSYLLTVLLFKYTSGCANLCPGNSSCNKKYTGEISHHQNSTLNLSSEILSNHSIGEGVHYHLYNHYIDSLSNHTTPVSQSHSNSSSSAHSIITQSIKGTGEELSPHLLLGGSQVKNYSTCSHRHSALHSHHHHQLSTNSAPKNLITMADGPFSPGDPNSFSRPELAEVKHIDLCLDVDFESKVLCGEGTYHIHVKEPNVSNVILDVHNLTIFEIVDKETNSPLNYTIGEHVDNFGSKLDISLPSDLEARHHQVELTIKYKTSPSSSALQWLEPAQTAGKTKPYMFSQCQPIHARSMLPVQDTPSVKQTYTATITAPKG
ncbi:hypothetical protein WDU94_000206, partial [Cyamophila willieti]